MKKQLTLLILFLSTFIYAQEASYSRIDSLLNYLNQNDKFMGSICIKKGNDVVLKESYGFAEATKGTRANWATKYKIASITKTYTATMIMQLVEEKKLTLATKLNKYFPKIFNSNVISIEDLLYQRTGIKDYLNSDESIEKNLYVANKSEDITKKIESYKSTFEPNSKHEYSNSNYFILGCIIEKITKKSFAENLQTRICNPLNLKHTQYSEEKIDARKRESYSYTFENELWKEFPEFNNSVLFSAGGIQSNAEDVTTFLRALLKGEIVSKGSVNLMKNIKDGYGMALIRFPFGERKFFGHNGKIEGFEAVAGYYEKDDTTICLLINGENFNQNEIMLGILSIYYKSPYRFPVFEKLNPAKIKDYIGNYSSKDINLKVTIFEKNGELFGQATGQDEFPLTFGKEDFFYFQTGNIEIEFKENAFVLKQGYKKFNYTKE